MKRLRNWMAGERGQTLVEFALLLPVVILFLVVIVDFGIALDRRITVQHAVREGGRYAAVHSDESDIELRTVAQAQDLITPADVGVCYLDGDDSNTSVGDPGDMVRVNASFTYDLLLVGPVLSGLFGGSAGSIEMIPSATSRLERSVSGAVAC